MPFQYALTRKYSHPYEKKILIIMRKSSHYNENFFSL